jgi:hypothetical protein
MSSPTEENKLALYVDGFNLYHAINDLGDPRLKWLNLHGLAKSLLRPGEALAKVHYFTALVDWDIHKKMRHIDYIKALESKGVLVTKGNFKSIDKQCPKNKWPCPFHEEKQTDVSIAVTMVADAFNGIFTRAILLTADTDQIPTIELLQAQFPQKTLTWLAPPGRMHFAREIGNLISDRSELTEGTIGTCRLPNIVLDEAGKLVCYCPQDYR